MRRFLAICCTIACCACARNASLENDFLKLRFTREGGRISSLIHKASGCQLTDSDGLLGDNIWNVNRAIFFLTTIPYRVTQTDQTCTLNVHATGGDINYLELNKVVTLKPDEAMFTADYSLKNLEAAMATLDYGYWMQNFVGTTKDRNSYFYPTENGINQIDEKNQSGEHYFSRPTRGWMASLNQKGIGLAITADFMRLRQTYSFIGKPSNTMEFYLEKTPIPAGKTADTRFEFIPFQGLKTVSGAGGGLVGELSVNPQRGKFQTETYRNRTLKLRIYSARKQQVRLVTTMRPVGRDKLYKLEDLTMDFSQPAQIREASLPVRFPVLIPAYDIETRAYDPQGKLLAIFNVPGVISSELGYAMLPQCVRPQDKAKPKLVDITTFDDSIVTPHITWAKPLHGKKIRLLALTPYPAYRELAELAQRMDIQLSTLFWTIPNRPTFANGNVYGTLTDDDVLNNLDRLLMKDYDVILMSGIPWVYLRAAQQNAIMEKVQNGCGFVEIQTKYVTPQQKDALSAFVDDKNVTMMSLKKHADGYLGTLIPFELFPFSIVNKLTSRGKVYARTNENWDFLTCYDHGKGRTVGIGWYTGGADGMMVKGLTPQLEYPQPAPYAYRDYDELHQLLLAKAVAAAARKDDTWTISQASAQSAGNAIRVSLSLNKDLPAGQAWTIQYFVRNREGQELTKGSHDISKAGVNATDFSFDCPRWAGRLMVGMKLLDPQGRVHDFGALSVSHAPQPAFTKIATDKPHYQEHDQATVTLSVSHPQAADRIRWQLTDAYGRLLQQGECKPAPQSTVTFTVTDTLKMRSYDVNAWLMSGDQKLDQITKRLTATPEPAKLAWDDYEPGIWLTPLSADAIRRHLHPLLAEKIRDMRMVTILGNWDPIQLDFAMQYNFNPTMLQHIGIGACDTPPQYLKSGNKMDLVRTPCLSDPAFREKIRKILHDRGQKYGDKGLRFYWFGDELTLVAYWSRPIDFCFSPMCRKNFQDFLIRKYGSLKAINQQWGTDHKTLDECISDTLAESQRHEDHNHSSWADRLEYMDSLLVDFVKDVTANGLRKADPTARGFISGNQAASAYGGNDWFKQPRAYDGLLGYNKACYYDLHRSFHPDKINIPWDTGYDHADESLGYLLWRNLMAGARGTMAFHATSLIHADFTLTPSGRMAAKFLPEITDGIGKLIINAVRRDYQGQIAIVYSQPSIRTSHVIGTAARHENLRWKYAQLCRNFGIPFRFVDDSEIEKGFLKQLKPRLLICPETNSLSDQALKNIRNQMKRGMDLAIEGDFATFDRNSRKRTESSRLRQNILKHAIVQETCDDLYHDALDTPEMKRTKTHWESINGCRKNFRKILDKADILPEVKLYDAQGKRFYDGEIDWMTDRQGNRYLMVISPSMKRQKLKVAFRTPAFLHDVRQGKAYGRSSRMLHELWTGNPLFVAMLNRNENAPLLCTEQKMPQGLAFNLNAQTGRDTVYHLTVRNPAGKEVWYYRQNLLAPHGKASLPFTFALNDDKGTWTFTFQEITTRKTVTIKVER